MGKFWFHDALQFGNNPLRQNLAEFDAPLVERVDFPNGALGKHDVFVQGNQLAQGLGVSLSARMVFDGRLPSKTRWGTSQSGVPSALTCSAVLPKASASAWANTLARSMSWCAAQRGQRVGKGDEVARNEPGSLVNQLIKGMLPVGAGFTPINGRCHSPPSARPASRVCRCSPWSTAGDRPETASGIARRAGPPRSARRRNRYTRWTAVP